MDYNDTTGMLACRANLVDGVCPMEYSNAAPSQVVATTVQAENIALQSIDAPAAGPVPTTAQLQQEAQNEYQAIQRGCSAARPRTRLPPGGHRGAVERRADNELSRADHAHSRGNFRGWA